MRTWLHAIALLLLAVSAAAQTPTPIPITGNLGTISGAPAPDSYALITLVNCSGGNPQITGFQGIVQTSYRFVADTNGDINGTIWPNDLITCSGTTGATLYSRQIVSDDIPVGQTQCYQIVHTQGAWNLNTQQPVTCGVTPPDPQDATYNNLVVNLNLQTNTLDVTGQATFTGTLVANGGITLPAIQDCPSNQWMTGLSATLAPRCGAVSTGVLSFNGRSGAVVPATGDYSYAQISGTPTLHYQTVNAQPQEPELSFSAAFSLSDTPGSLTGVDLANSGANAGTYTNPSVTINAKGIVTNISNGSSGAAVSQWTHLGTTSCNFASPGTGDTCLNTLTFSPGFADTSYGAVCWGKGPTSGGTDSSIQLSLASITNATQISVQSEALSTGSNLHFADIYCVGVHN